MKATIGNLPLITILLFGWTDCDHTSDGVSSGNPCFVFQQSVERVTEQVMTLTEEVNRIKGGRPQNTGNYGAVYTRWGSTRCNANSSLVYSGYAGGSPTDVSGFSGAATTTLCLPRDPEWAIYNDEYQKLGGLLGGAEYRIFYQKDSRQAKQFHDIPCAVCRTYKSPTLMIPAKKTCPAGWTMEYWGYLMSSYFKQVNQGEFLCMDKDLEALDGGSGMNVWGRLFNLVEAYCGGMLRCPPYVHGREVTCVVCSGS